MALGWLATKTVAVDALVRRSPVIAASFAPQDPRIAPALAMMEFRQRQGAVTPAIARSAIASLQRAPLIEEPFLLAAVDKMVLNDFEGAEPLLLEARRRNPRSQMPRILLLDRLLRTGRVQEAAAEITVISRLVPGSNGVLVPQLAKFAEDPKTRIALANVLKSDANIRVTLLEHLASNGGDPEMILDLAGPAASTASPSAPAPRWQSLLLASLVEKGELAKARLLWAQFAGNPQLNQGHGIYDGNFQRLPGPPPFNWEFANSPGGVAEPTRARELQVEYYGRADAELASQLLTLRPGRHGLDFRASGDTPERGSGVFWQLICHASKVQLATVPITGLSYTPKQFKGEFTVPASGCSGQWLRLVGTPAEFPTAHSIKISKTEIQPAGAS